MTESLNLKRCVFTSCGLFTCLWLFSNSICFCFHRDEVHTVWEFMHPAFMPVFFVITFILLTIIVSEEKVSYKLLLITVHSILSHTFFVFVFPASGDISAQQTVLGTTRLLYDNIIVQDPVRTLNPWIYGLAYTSQIFTKQGHY